MITKRLVLFALVALSVSVLLLSSAPQTFATPPASTQAQSIAAPDAQDLVWNLADDFRVTPDQANPNPDSYGNADTWSFMRSTTAHYPTTYSLVTQWYPNVGENAGLQGWEGPEPTGYPQSGLPEFTLNTTGVPFNFDPQMVYPPGSIEVHPDSSQPAVVRWLSPFTGAIAITGGVQDVCWANGDGINWFIDKNGTTLASGSYPSGGLQLFKDGTNGGQLANVSVNQGDSIYFLVAPGGDYICDGTKLDVTIKMVSIVAPDAPKLVSPANNATGVDSNVQLKWQAPPFATRYKVTVKNSAAKTVAALTVFGDSRVRIVLSPNDTYSWSVQACNTGGCSGPSKTWKFKN